MTVYNLFGPTPLDVSTLNRQQMADILAILLEHLDITAFEIDGHYYLESEYDDE